jgi:hypothetical protein
MGEVNRYFSMVSSDSINKYNIDEIDLVLQPAILKLNLISSELNIVDNELL